jgi:hypothetical protein
MEFKRTPFKTIKNIRFVLEFNLRQFKLVRFICGGVWYKQEGSWSQADVLSFAEDGTMFLCRTYRDLSDIAHFASFHESHSCIQAIEKY